MKDIVYVPIIKTGDAEIRGVENLTEELKNNITPLFELTRSRRSRKVPEGDIFRRLNRLEEAYGRRRFIIDLTADPSLSNEQIERLHDSHRGYNSWLRFLVSLQERFREIIPVIQISDIGVDSEAEFYRRIQAQVRALNKYFDIIVYRFPLEYQDFKGDIAAICDAISNNKVMCIIDATFIAQNKSNIYSSRALDVINEIEEFSLWNTALAATSFPRNPAGDGGETEDEFRLEECTFYQEVSDGLEFSPIYGDYATIHPTRSPQAGGQGWVPRIDVPTQDTIFYFRSRRDSIETSYRPAYIRIGERMCRDERYMRVRNEIEACWGIEQIELAAQGYPQGLSPSFWISVRMNTHMTLRRSLL